MASRKNPLTDTPVYIDDAYIYLKAVCEKSILFKHSMDRIRERHNIKPAEEDGSDAGKIKRLKGDEEILNDPSFQATMRRFFIPKELWEAISRFVARFGKESFLEDAIRLSTPTNKRTLHEDTYSFVPKFHVTIPITTIKKDLLRLWEEIQKHQKAWMGGKRSFASSKKRWRNSESFDAAFAFYEAKKSTASTKAALEQSYQQLTTIDPKNKSRYAQSITLERASNLRKDALKIERGIAALSHYFNK